MLTVAPTGSEASIIRIAGAGFRLSLLLNAAACQLAQSRIEFHSIAKSISLFSLTLKRLGKLFSAGNVEISPVATEKAWEIASQGQVVMVEIENMLEKLQSTDTDDELRKFSPQERLSWYFRKQHVSYLLAQLESLKLSLLVMSQVLQLGVMLRSNSKAAAENEFDSNADDVLAQEKAETQNMIIVRYWSVRRVDRLWGLVEQEAMDAAKNPISQRIETACQLNTSSAVKPLVAATNGSTVTKLHAVTFGEIDSSLNNLERSPRDMVHLSEKAMEHLLSLWVPSLNISRLHRIGKIIGEFGGSSPPRVQISTPDTEIDSAGQDFDSPNVRGYYLEGNTTDWRKPHSQEARHQATQLRQRYSTYQAHVDSDSEAEDYPVDAKDSSIFKSADPNNEGEQRPTSYLYSYKNVSRPHSHSMSSRYPSHPQSPEARQPTYSSGSFPPPDQPAQGPQIPPNLQPGPYRASGPPPAAPPTQAGPRYYQDHANTPRSAPMNINQPHRGPPSPRNTPPSPYDSWTRPQAYNGASLQPRHHHSVHPLSSSSPEMRNEMSFRTSPPRSAQRTPPSDHSRRSSREERKERNKELGRTATRGIAGIGAIAGFMDALEAFQLL